MKFIKSIILFLSLMVTLGCSNMRWYQGGVIEYKSVKNPTDKEYVVHVLGSMPHSEEDLVSAALMKVEELCGSKVMLVNKEMGSYKTTAVGGGVVFSGSSPEITVTAKCVDS